MRKMVLETAAALVIVAWSGTAAADNICDITSCSDGGNCVIDCHVEGQYAIFGRIKVDDTWAGVGVCWWGIDGSYAKSGNFLGYDADGTSAATYVVNMDNAVNGSADLVRLAAPGGEICRDVFGQPKIEIFGELLNANQHYDFYGWGGNDHIHVCSVGDATEPTSGECIANHAGASGDDGDDYVYGGYYGDVLTGAGDSDIVYGWGDGDTLYGGPGVDAVLGGAGADAIDGGTGDDYLYGQDGCDSAIDGGVGSDKCYCQDSSPSWGSRVNCEVPISDGDAYCSGSC